jgi:hypothetical protein
MTPWSTASVLTIVARPVPERSRSAAKRFDDTRAQLRERHIPQPREDAQVEVDRVALLRGEGEATLGVVGPPFADYVLAQRDVVGEQDGIAGLLEPPHASVEIPRVVLKVEGPRGLRRAATALAPTHAVHDRAVGPRLTMDTHAAVRLPRLARTRARRLSVAARVGAARLSVSAGITRAWRAAEGVSARTLVDSIHASRSASRIRSLPPGL